MPILDSINRMKLTDFFGKIFKKKTSPKEDLYTKILLWAHDKQETGFTWQEMRDHFNLTDSQMSWVNKIFLTTSDSDRKFFEQLRDDGSVRYYSLNEKGITAAINYKGLRHAEKNSELALWVAIISIAITAIGLGLAWQQINLSEIQNVPQQIDQARAVQFCKENPTSQESGLFEVATGNPAPCSEVLQNYGGSASIWARVRDLF